MFNVTIKQFFAPFAVPVIVRRHSFKSKFFTKVCAMTQESEIKSTCGMCFAACGVLIQVRDGKVVKVKGDPQSPVTHGVLCPKGRAAPQLLYHPDRLKHPLKRIGKKGTGQWAKISWDDALGTIADAFIKTRDRFGPESVAFIQGSAKGLIDSYNDLF